MWKKACLIFFLIFQHFYTLKWAIIVVKQNVACPTTITMKSGHRSKLKVVLASHKMCVIVWVRETDNQLNCWSHRSNSGSLVLTCFKSLAREKVYFFVVMIMRHDTPNESRLISNMKLSLFYLSLQTMS